MAQSAAAKLPLEGLIDRPIARSSHQPTKFKISRFGKASQTKFWQQPTKTKEETTEIFLRPITGRSHQIRLHLASLGCPIKGDQIYGGQPSWRLWLHSQSLELEHPRSKEIFKIEAPLPPSWPTASKLDQF